MLTFMLEAWFGFNILKIIFLIIINIKNRFSYEVNQFLRYRWSKIFWPN